MTLITWLVAFVLTAAQAPSAAPQRFDYLVRADFFAGVGGDAARLQRAIDLCERTLAENPKHAEALVWHGAGLLVRAGQAFAKGDAATGGPLFGRALKEMDDAVALAADNPAVLIPRAAVLLEATKNMPPDTARPLVQSAIANYEHVLDVQAPAWPRLGDHGKGELLFGLAEGFARLGQQDKARMYFERLITDAPTSGQAPKAKEWIASGTIPKSSGTSCVGCHK
jgi:tetratricopeptide (TPR) repeat protein